MAIVGIDLGTTNSLVTAWRDGAVQVIPNGLGGHLTPSVVSVDFDGSILVGASARERLITHPRDTVATFKRAMGTAQTFVLGKRSFRAEELSSFVLRALKADAEAFLGEAVTEAVVSVPAYFNELQRQATKAAAQMAGLKVDRMINEPTAAAIAYGVGKIESEGTFLVFDLGGGTFDISILELFDRTMEVHASAGDVRLGGEDFRWRMAESFLLEHDVAWPTLTPIEKSILMASAEEAKNALSDSETVLMECRLAGRDLVWPVTRSQYEENCIDLLERLKAPVERALRDSKRDPASIDEVLLVGGATRMPMVRDLVSRLFGNRPRTDIDPDRVVAIGAGVQAMLRTSDTAFEDVVLTDVCPWTLGTDVHDENEPGDKIVFSPIIPRNCTVPVSRSKSYWPMRDDQRAVMIKIYQGESRRVENNIQLGEIKVPLPNLPKSKNQVDVRFTYDVNGILEVLVTHTESGKEHRLLLERNPGTLTAEQIEARMKELAPLKIHPRETQEARHLLAVAERLYEEALGPDRDEIGHAISSYQGALEGQDPETCKRAQERFREFLERTGGLGPI